MVKEIADRFYRITLPMPFRLKHVHVYVMVHDEGVALFDTGLNTPDTYTTLVDGLHAIGLSTREIRQIYLSHRHGDHCGMAGRIKDLSGAVIYMSAIDHQFIEMYDKEDVLTELMRSFYLRHGLTERALDVLTSVFRSFRKVISPFRADDYLDTGQRHDLGGRAFQVFRTPGHTSGHICYYFEKEQLLLAGDHVLPDITPNLSPELLNPAFRPLEEFLISLGRLQDLPVAMVCPAHGEPFSNLYGRIVEIRDHHQERKGLILESARQGPKTAFDISLDIFGSDLPSFDQFLALNETYVHLVELIIEGSLKEVENGGFILFGSTW